MQTITKATLGLLALGVSGWMLTAQDSEKGPPNEQAPPPNGGPGRPGGPRLRRLPPPPLVSALDANHDGVIDETEIANASAALKTLDKNGDGKLTIDELRPPLPPRGLGPGFPPEPPPPGGENEQRPAERR